ncbi:DUF6879 family protein [Streptomyces sp. NPDC005141]
MPPLTPFSEVGHLFREFEHTAWRLEQRRRYATDLKSTRWAAFKAGEDITGAPDNLWRKNVREQTSRGKRFERVRVVDDPPTEGQRFLLAGGLTNVAAGEDIRNLYRAGAAQLGLPDFDFWLLDSRLLLRFEFDDADTTLGVHIIKDPADVLAACQARDAAWHYAVRTAEFQRRVRSTV